MNRCWLQEKCGSIHSKPRYLCSQPVCLCYYSEYPEVSIAMRKTVFCVLCLVVFVTAVSVGASAQTPEAKPRPPQPAQPTVEQAPGPIPCPRLEVKTVQGPVRDGMPVRFTAALNGADGRVTPMLSWSISSGVINSGQGTTSIEVDSTGAGADKAIIATLMVGDRKSTRL